ncbi:MAG: hypothetical protein ACREMD_09130 [Gemmatimonadota bacterium]
MISPAAWSVSATDSSSLARRMTLRVASGEAASVSVASPVGASGAAAPARL